MSTEDLIRTAYAAYLARDRETFEKTLGDEFVFTSPWDDRIDKATYFERCWPGGDRFADFQIEKLFAEGDEAFIRYLITLRDGSRFRNTELIKTKGGRITEVEVYFGTEADGPGENAEIMKVLDRRAQAVREKNASDHAALYAGNAVLFGLAPPLTTGYEQEKGQGWFDTFQGPIGFEVTDLCLTSGEELVVARSLNRITGSRSDGQTTEIWVRETLALRRLKGVWKIIHEHTSVPFYMDGSVKAAVDLRP